jgi:hypothetical protein
MFPAEIITGLHVCTLSDGLLVWRPDLSVVPVVAGGVSLEVMCAFL